MTVGHAPPAPVRRHRGAATLPRSPPPRARDRLVDRRRDPKARTVTGAAPP